MSFASENLSGGVAAEGSFAAACAPPRWPLTQTAVGQGVRSDPTCGVRCLNARQGGGAQRRASRALPLLTLSKQVAPGDQMLMSAPASGGHGRAPCTWVRSSRPRGR